MSQDKLREIIEQVVREEVHEEFDIPIICPPANRVEDKICDRVIPSILNWFKEEIKASKGWLRAMREKDG